MKGILLAGGTGQRLRPLTERCNKHLLPIAGRPMIHYPLTRLIDAGIDEVLIVTGTEHLGAFREALGQAQVWGLRTLAFAGQDRPRGVADALLHGEAFAEGGPVCVVLGDQLFEASLREPTDAYRSGGARGAMVLLHATDEPERFGVARFDRDDALREIVEKPGPALAERRPPAVVGVYWYDAAVFDICRGLRPSPRGELEITGVNNAYLARGALRWCTLEGWWIDVGTHESLAAAEARLSE